MGGPNHYSQLAVKSESNTAYCNWFPRELLIFPFRSRWYADDAGWKLPKASNQWLFCKLAVPHGIQAWTKMQACVWNSISAQFLAACIFLLLLIHLYLFPALPTSPSLSPTTVHRGRSPSWATSCRCLPLTTLPANATQESVVLCWATIRRTEIHSFQDGVRSYVTKTSNSPGLSGLFFAIRWKSETLSCFLLVSFFRREVISAVLLFAHRPRSQKGGLVASKIEARYFVRAVTSLLTFGPCRYTVELRCSRSDPRCVEGRWKKESGENRKALTNFSFLLRRVLEAFSLSCKCFTIWIMIKWKFKRKYLGFPF